MLPWMEFYKTHHLYQNQEPLLMQYGRNEQGLWNLPDITEPSGHLKKTFFNTHPVSLSSWLEISIWRDFLYGQFKNTQVERYPPEV